MGAGGGKKRQEMKRNESKKQTNKHTQKKQQHKKHVAKFSLLFKVRKLNLSCAYKHATDTNKQP